MAFSDNDCRELTDSIDDDGAVDEENVCIKEKNSRTKNKPRDIMMTQMTLSMSTCK
jgi:hypothetical protein